jgi:hypothetical protein
VRSQCTADNCRKDSTNFKGDYGNSDFDTRNSFVGYANYAVPAFKGPKLLTNGFELNTVITLKGGEPVNLVTSTDTTGENEYTQRPNIIGNPYSGITHSIQNGIVRWFNPAAFANPAFGTYGNYARNSLFGPGVADVDLSIFKNTPITERINTQFRVEMFNLFNRLNLANPGPEQLGNDAFGTSSFAQIPSTIGAGNYSPGIGPGEPFNVHWLLRSSSESRLRASSSTGVCRCWGKFWAKSRNPRVLLSVLAVRLTSVWCRRPTLLRSLRRA